MNTERAIELVRLLSYEYFIPSMESLLAHIGTDPQKQTLRRAFFRFDADVQETILLYI